MQIKNNEEAKSSNEESNLNGFGQIVEKPMVEDAEIIEEDKVESGPLKLVNQFNSEAKKLIKRE